MKTISMLEFRRDAERIVKAVSRGEHFLLSYRGKVTVHLEPVDPQLSVREDDPVYRLTDLATDGTPLSNEQIDKTIYG